MSNPSLFQLQLQYQAGIIYAAVTVTMAAGGGAIVAPVALVGLVVVI